ncbi:hypothetical protein A1OE_479 [Candidatus Endolissoclinum faulkneri L2]|uniref:Porin domain-containing protein n=1 Tax=Candidatus Endolissoclinum faulkneri L2 TaxID=1193729 RepID=K7YMD0_9PROT|nr:porin [Candidatus Endolissoclinum faulkneri]AFX98672.1 hypothetical protein A1OE_479 [Candidatus Endolissoclinum faulkneri L2]
MKKSVLGSTAFVAAGLIAAPSAIAAERLHVSVGGYMEQWLGYTTVEDGLSRDIDGFDVKSDSEIHFEGSTTLDNGIDLGVNVQLEANTDKNDQIDESYLFMKGSFGEINLGSVNSAMHNMHFAPSDFGIGINSGDQADWAAFSNSKIDKPQYSRSVLGSTYIDPNPSHDSEKLTYYTPRFAGIQLGASYSPDDLHDNNQPVNRHFDRSDMVALGANYTGDFSGVSMGVSLGYGTFLDQGYHRNKAESYNAGITLGMGGIGIGASWAEANDSLADGSAYNLGLSYETGPLGVSLTYLNGVIDKDIAQNTFHLSGKYALGPGIDAKATLGHANYEKYHSDEIDATYLVTGIRVSF